MTLIPTVTTPWQYEAFPICETVTAKSLSPPVPLLVGSWITTPAHQSQIKFHKIGVKIKKFIKCSYFPFLTVENNFRMRWVNFTNYIHLWPQKLISEEIFEIRHLGSIWGQIEILTDRPQELGILDFPRTPSIRFGRKLVFKLSEEISTAMSAIFLISWKMAVWRGSKVGKKRMIFFIIYVRKIWVIVVRFLWN